MDGQRPPRAVRPHSLQQSPRSPAPAYADPSRPSLVSPDSRTNVSFQNIERGDRNSQLDAPRQRNMPSAYQAHLPYAGDLESPELSDVSKVGRKKSLVRPDREKIDPGHRQWHYRSHVAQLEQEGNARVGVMPSSASAESFTQVHFIDLFSTHTATGNFPQQDTLRRGQSLLGREEDVHESGLALFKRGTLRRKKAQPSVPISQQPLPDRKRGCWKGPGPSGPWMVYCYIITIWVPTFLMRQCGGL